MLNIFDKNQYFNTVATIAVLVIFLSVAIFYNFSIAKKADALFGGGGFSLDLSPIGDIILDIVSEAIEIVIDFIMDNKELLIGAAIVAKWWHNPKDALDEVWATVKSLAMHTMLTLITMDIIAQIQGEEPKYINDWDTFFQETVNQAGGLFVEQYLGMGYFCEKWDVDIKLALLDEYEFKDVECTLEDMVDNVDDFLESFSEGGWTGFLELVKPQNNPYGTILMAQGEKKRVEERAKEAGKAEGMAGRGFLSLKACIKGHATLMPENRTQTCNDKDSCKSLESRAGTYFVCEKTKTETPGSVISDTVSKTLNKPTELLTGMTEDIVDKIPKEYQPYANAVITAFLNQIMKDAMQAMLGRRSETDYEAAISGAFTGAATPELVGLEGAAATNILNALNDLETALDETTGFLETIKNKEINILNSSVNELFTQDPIASLPSFESYVINYDPPPPTLELTAADVGLVNFRRTVSAGREGEMIVSVNIISTSPEIATEQSLYDPINTLWDTAYTECNQYIDALVALQDVPSNTDLQNAADTEEAETIAAANNLLVSRELTAANSNEVATNLHTAEQALIDKLGKNAYNPALEADGYTAPFLNTYYFKYYYNLIPKEEELDNIINPPEPEGPNGP